MAIVRVKYDAYNRQFTLVDHPISADLEDGEVYTLTFPSVRETAVSEAAEPDPEWEPALASA